MASTLLILLLIVAVLLFAKKFATDTIMKAIKIGSFIISVIMVIKNRHEIYLSLESFFHQTIPFLISKLAHFVNSLISYSSDMADKMFAKFRKEF